MNIEIKHEIGKTVYYIKQISVPTFNKCRVCSGEGVLYRKDGSDIICPECHGNKTYTNSGSIKEVVLKGIVDHIQLDIDVDTNINTYYFIEKYDDHSEYTKFDEFTEIHLYDTQEEAEKNIHENLHCGYTS